jgi:hypothetical protein
MKVLSKSRFKVGLECPNKLYFYGDKTYANQKEENTFLASLAEGGFQVEALARLHYPNGVFIDARAGDYKAAFSKTQQALEKENVVIYEASFLHNGLYVMTDILVKQGNKIKLIEVKAKSFDSTKENEFVGRRGDVTSGWRPYLFDIAFQKHVAQQCYKEFKIDAYFMMADKSKVATIEGLNQKIRLPASGDIRKDVIVKLTPEQAQKTSVLSEVNVSAIVQDIISGHHTYYDNLSFSEAIPLLKSIYSEKTYPSWPTHYSRCKSCQFRATTEEKKSGLLSGFEHCFKSQHNWSEEDFNRSNIFEIWNFRGQKFLEENRLFLDDLTEEDFKVKEVPDKMGPVERRWIQVERTLETPSEPYVKKNALKAEIQKWEYPLHFIDFETSAVALPFNKGRRPYEQIAFQFSHHTCYADGRIEHTSEYINNVPGEFPNFLFVSALKKALGKDNGTIFRFATHENSILNAIKNQLETSIYPDKKELIDFIKTITTPTQKSTDTWKASRTMIDLRVVILNYYYNPLTKGSNSLKAVLPAILNSCSFLKEKYTQSLENINLTSLNFGPNHIWLKFKDGKAVDPYKALPSIFKDWAPEKLDGIISGLSNISDGGGALTAYSKLQFVDMSTHERETITTSLLKYCELDTLAMVMIYEHLLNISA